MCTSPGSHPTTLVVRRTLASSARATMATTYGGSKPGSQRWALTVKPTTVPSPDTAVCSRLQLRQAGQMGTGGCTSFPQSPQPWMRSTPSAPEVQNQPVSGVSSGNGLTACLPSPAAECGPPRLRTPPPAAAAAGGGPASGAARSRRCGGDCLARDDGPADGIGAGNELEARPRQLGDPQAVVHADGRTAAVAQIERVGAEQARGVEILDARQGVDELRRRRVGRCCL